jgi:hypothetical protein
MKSTIISTLSLLTAVSAQIASEWGRSRIQKTRLHRSLQDSASPIIIEDLSMSMQLSMSISSMPVESSMPVDYIPPVEEPVIGTDSEGNPITANSILSSSASGVTVAGAFLCGFAGAVALF